MAMQAGTVAKVPGSGGAGEGASARGVAADRRCGAHRLVVWGVIASCFASIALVSALNLDIGAARYLQNDLLFRGAESIQFFHRQPVMDPSPHSIALPADLFLKRALSQGELPTWDRSQGGGYSPVSQGNLGMLFPVRWFAALFPAAQVHSVVMLTTFAACLLFGFLAIRCTGMGVQAACLGALVYGVSGFMVGQLLFDGVAVYLFLPWIAYAYFRHCEEPGPARFAHLVIAFGLSFTSGHLMLLASVFIGVGALALAHAVSGMAVGARKLRNLCALASASVWGALLAAPFLLPFAFNFRGAWKYKTQTAEGMSYVVSDLADWIAKLQSIALDAPGPFMDGPGFYLYLGLPVLALAGLGAFASWRTTERRFIAAFLIAMFLFCVPGPWMAFASDLPPLTYIRTFYLYALFVFAISLAAAAGVEWICKHPSVPAAGAVGWLLVVAVGGTFAARGLGSFEPVPGAARLESKPVAFLKHDTDLYRVTGLWGQVHLPNIAHLTGIEDLRLLAVTLSARYHAWFEIVDPTILGKNFPTARMTEQLSSPLIGAFNVKYVLEGKLPHHYFVTQLTTGDPFGAFDPRATHLTSDHLQQRYEDGLLRIHEVTDTYRARAYFPSNVAPVSPGIESATKWLRNHPERHADTAVVEVDDASIASRLRAIDATATRSVSVRYPSDTQVELTVRADAPGLVVLNDMFEAGWSARVNGVPREILATNLISRGVWLEGGESLVVMHYSPPGFMAGFAVAGIALATLLFRTRRNGLRHPSDSRPWQRPISRPQLTV